MEEEFIRNQERLKPQEEKNEEERTKVISSNILLKNNYILIRLDYIFLKGFIQQSQFW